MRGNGRGGDGLKRITQSGDRPCLGGAASRGHLLVLADGHVAHQGQRMILTDYNHTDSCPDRFLCYMILILIRLQAAARVSAERQLVMASSLWHLAHKTPLHCRTLQ